MAESTSSNGKIKLTLTGERVGANGKTIKTGTINVEGKTGSIDLFDSGDCSTEPKWLRENAYKAAGSRNTFEVFCQQTYRDK